MIQQNGSVKGTFCAKFNQQLKGEERLVILRPAATKTHSSAALSSSKRTRYLLKYGVWPWDDMWGIILSGVASGESTNRGCFRVGRASKKPD